jgi:hypothetical protein
MVDGTKFNRFCRLKASSPRAACDSPGELGQRGPKDSSRSTIASAESWKGCVRVDRPVPPPVVNWRRRPTEHAIERRLRESAAGGGGVAAGGVQMHHPGGKNRVQTRARVVQMHRAPLASRPPVRRSPRCLPEHRPGSIRAWRARQGQGATGFVPDSGNLRINLRMLDNCVIDCVTARRPENPAGIARTADCAPSPWGGRS